MTRFGSNPRGFFDEVYRDVAPWDIGQPQPAMMQLVATHPPPDPVLEVGCGTGDLAIALAGSGGSVLGIDFVEAAIAQAQAKVDQLAPEVAGRLRFEVGDARHPGELGRTFGAVVDSGFFHLFDAAEGDSFVAELTSVLQPGGRYYLLAFATEFPIPNSPRAVGEAELRRRFAIEHGWRVIELRDTEFQSRIAPVPAVAACVERCA